MFPTSRNLSLSYSFTLSLLLSLFLRSSTTTAVAVPIDALTVAAATPAVADLYHTPAVIPPLNTPDRKTVIITTVQQLDTLETSESDGSSKDEDGTKPDDLTDPNAFTPKPSRFTTALLVLLIGIAFLVTSYLIYSPPAHLIDTYFKPSLSHLPHLSVPFSKIHLHIPQSLQPTLKRLHAYIPIPTSPRKSRRRRRATARPPSQFRVGEGRLVEWAREDMALLDNDNGNDIDDGMDEDMEADLMVNAEDTFNNDEGLIDGYIPLSMGMGWGLGRSGSAAKPPVRNYGTTMKG